MTEPRKEEGVTRTYTGWRAALILTAFFGAVALIAATVVTLLWVVIS